MGYWVKRSKEHRTSWTGPIRSALQVEREAEAWRSCGWMAETLLSTPEVRAEVRAWDKAKKYTEGSWK